MTYNNLYVCVYAYALYICVYVHVYNIIVFYTKSAILQSIESFVFIYAYSIHDYALSLGFLTKFFATSGHKTIETF